MSKRRNKKNNNVKENVTMREETVVTTEDIQELTDEELGVETEEETSDEEEYFEDEDGQKVKVVYVEVEKPSKVKAFFNRHKKLITGIGVGLITTGATAGAAAIAYNVGKKTGTGTTYDNGDDYLIKVTTPDEATFNALCDGVDDVLSQSQSEFGSFETNF